jgi:hypothetical protein
LSSSFADFHLASGIAEALRARQVHVIDPNEPKRSVVNFADSVASKLGAADLAVMIVGKRTGEWLDWETKKLLAEDKDIIPVVFAEKVPDRLANKNPIRIKPGESADAIADRDARAEGRHVQRVRTIRSSKPALRANSLEVAGRVIALSRRPFPDDHGVQPR